MSISPREIVVHLIWCIAVLIGVIIFFLLKSPEGALVRDYIAFAATFVSLVLGVVAIIFSIVSNQDFSRLSSSLQQSAGKIDVSSASIASSAEGLRSDSAILAGQVEALPPAIRELSVQLEKQANATATNSVIRSIDGPVDKTSEKPSVRTTFGTNLAMYLIFKSHELGKSFTVSEMKEINISTRQYMSGSVQLIALSRYLDIDIIELDRKLTVKSVGKIGQKFVENVENSTADVLKINVVKIMDYLEKQDSIADEVPADE